MADDQDQKSEAPTPRRLQRAREEGQIGYSGELVSGIVLLLAVLYFWTTGRTLWLALQQIMQQRLLSFETAIAYPQTLAYLAANSAESLILPLGLLLLPMFVVALISGGLQTQFNITMKPLELKWDRMNPIQGWQRIFSLRSVVRGFSAMVKAALITLIAWMMIESRLPATLVTAFGTLDQSIQKASEIFIAVSLAVAAAMVLVGVADLGFQKWKHLQDLRMSFKDLRDEHREDEGDPMIAARMRRLRQELVKKSLARDVPRADVVITNPTHFAVALRYDKQESPAPIVVAKGGDLIAKRIIEIAKQHKIPVVERKPIARFLYYNVKVGAEIPFELYKAVAEILNFVNRSKRAG